LRNMDGFPLLSSFIRPSPSRLPLRPAPYRLFARSQASEQRKHASVSARTSSLGRVQKTQVVFISFDKWGTHRYSLHVILRPTP
jgi:hypothetical protein